MHAKHRLTTTGNSPIQNSGLDRLNGCKDGENKEGLLDVYRREKVRHRIMYHAGRSTEHHGSTESPTLTCCEVARTINPLTNTPLKKLPLSNNYPSQATTPLKQLPLSNNYPSQTTTPLKQQPLSNNYSSQTTTPLKQLPLSNNYPSQTTTPLKQLPLSKNYPS